MYQTEEFGLFIGLTTVDYEQLKDFREKEIRKPFEQYREKIIRYCDQLAENQQELSSTLLDIFNPVEPSGFQQGNHMG